MRFALLATTSLIALALASYACSSSDDNKGATTPDAGKPSTSSSSSGSSGDDDDSTSSSGGETSSGTASSSGSTSSGGNTDGGSTTSSSSGSTSGAPFDAGPTPTTPEGQTTPGTLCEASDQKETTPDNFTPEKAVALTTTTGTAKTAFCGSIEGTNDTIDYFTYTFNVTGAFSFSASAKYSAAAPKVTLIVEGVEYAFGAANIPVKSGKPVLFKITNATKVDYRINFDVTQN
ncbi:MAG: hypothetical protein U0270_22425 [Labilithrix sp.]